MSLLFDVAINHMSQHMVVTIVRARPAEALPFDEARWDRAVVVFPLDEARRLVFYRAPKGGMASAETTTVYTMTRLSMKSDTDCKLGQGLNCDRVCRLI